MRLDVAGGLLYLQEFQEVRSNASEGMDVAVRVISRRQRSEVTSFCVLSTGCHEKGVAQFEGGSSQPIYSHLEKYL